MIVDYIFTDEASMLLAFAFGYEIGGLTLFAVVVLTRLGEK